MKVDLEKLEVCTNCKHLYHNRIIKKECGCGKGNYVDIFEYLRNSAYKNKRKLTLNIIRKKFLNDSKFQD